MKLIDYVMQKGGTGTLTCPVVAKVAADARCSTGTLYMIARGHKTPGARLAGRIADATANAVTRHDLLPDVFPGPALEPVDADPDSDRIVPVEGV
ncbi:hypothetical protein GGR77_001542 [Xanthomonas translucens]